MSFFNVLNTPFLMIALVVLLFLLAMSLLPLYTRRIEKARQQKEQQESEKTAKRECSRLLRMEAEEQRLLKKAEHDAAIDLLCDRISMVGIVICMQRGDDLDAEDLAVIQRYQAEGEPHTFAVKRFAAACGYAFAEEG